jgi:hypothetical protein
MMARVTPPITSTITTSPAALIPELWLTGRGLIVAVGMAVISDGEGDFGFGTAGWWCRFLAFAVLR